MPGWLRRLLMKDQGMTTLCAWHSVYFPKEMIGYRAHQISGKPLSRSLLNGEPVSHGLCKRCAKKFRQESRGRIT